MYPHFAVIALGSNLANPAEQVRAALAELAAHPHIRLEKASSLYLTAPVGYDDQPDFVNAVCAVKTARYILFRFIVIGFNYLAGTSLTLSI